MSTTLTPAQKAWQTRKAQAEAQALARTITALLAWATRAQLSPAQKAWQTRRMLASI
jgi:hypothetical protein